MPAKMAAKMPAKMSAKCPQKSAKCLQNVCKSAYKMPAKMPKIMLAKCMQKSLQNAIQIPSGIPAEKHAKIITKSE